MGCGSSNFSSVVPADDDVCRSNGLSEKIQNGGNREQNGGAFKNGFNGRYADAEDLPTVLLSEPPAQLKPPLAFEIPIEEFLPSENHLKKYPPKRIQQLEEKCDPVTSIEDIKEKQAEAENRRLMILQQRIMSASKRSQKVTKMVYTDSKITEGENEIENLQITPRIPELKNTLAPPDLKLR